MSFRRAGFLIVLASSSLVAQTPLQAPQQPNPNRPSLFVVGDLPSAALYDTFDPSRLKLVDGPAKGQTTRTYINSGTWDQITAQMKPGDFVLIGFKPDSNASPAKLGTDASAAATRTFDGAGDSTFDYMDPDSHKLEHVHNYAWYLRKFVVDTINHGANPILCYPPMPVDPHASSPSNPYLAYPAWIIHAIATEQHVPFINLGASGTDVNPAFRSGLEALQPDPLSPYLKHTTP